MASLVFTTEGGRRASQSTAARPAARRASEAIQRLKRRTSSPLNTAFIGMVELTPVAGLPWDCIITAENARCTTSRSRKRIERPSPFSVSAGDAMCHFHNPRPRGAARGERMTTAFIAPAGNMVRDKRLTSRRGRTGTSASRRTSRSLARPPWLLRSASESVRPKQNALHGDDREEHLHQHPRHDRRPPVHRPGHDGVRCIHNGGREYRARNAGS